MRVGDFGDIVGENTIKVFQKHLEEIKKEYKINIALCNAENVTNGKGLSFKHYKALKSLGFSGMSMGNHTFSKKEIKEYIDEATIVRPANLNTEYGKDVLYIKYNDKTIALVNMLGRVYSNTPLDCPFKTMDKLLSVPTTKAKSSTIIKSTGTDIFTHHILLPLFAFNLQKASPNPPA